MKVKLGGQEVGRNEGKIGMTGGRQGRRQAGQKVQLGGQEIGRAGGRQDRRHNWENRR